MTKEEARRIIAAWLASSKWIKGRCGYIEGWFNERDVEAFRMAIEELEQNTVLEETYTHEFNLRKTLEMKVFELEKKLAEQEPSKDCISRQAAIEAICKDGTRFERQGQYSMTMAERKQRDTDILEALPSRTEPKHGKWIPVSERLPEDGYWLWSATSGGSEERLLLGRALGTCREIRI